MELVLSCMSPNVSENKTSNTYQETTLTNFHSIKCLSRMCMLLGYLLQVAVSNLLGKHPLLQKNLECNITFPSIEITGRKPCSIREHIIGIVMVSECDFDNVTCVWSCNMYAL